MPVMGTLQLSTGLSRTGQEVNEREEGVVASHLPTGPLKTCSGLESILRCEPSTYQPISQ